GTEMRLAYIHPLVQAAVHDSINHAERTTAHHRAAQVLTTAGADPERIAAHLLRTHVTGTTSIDTLRSAARLALAHGSPENAITYLERCVIESLPDDEKAELLEEIGIISQSVDNGLAEKYLRKSMALAPDQSRTVRSAIALGNSLMLLARSAEAAQVWMAALKELPSDQADNIRRIYASIINLAILEPRWTHLFDKLSELERLPFHDSVGGRSLESLIGAHKSLLADPAATEHARRALSGDLLIKEASGEAPLVVAWFVLIFSDAPDVSDGIETALAQAYEKGAVKDLTAGLTFRMLNRLRWGDLAGAEADGRECLRAIDSSRMNIARPFAGPFLVDVLIEQGRFAEADSVLSWVGIRDPIPASGPMYYFLDSRARLLRSHGRLQDALESALAAGERFSSHGGVNPSWIPWRSEAALCLHALNQIDDARRYALEELELARQAGAPRALGHALRVTGLLTGGADGCNALKQAVAILDGSPARLEHAKALADYGAGLRRTGHRVTARDPLRRALDIATRCGATPVAEQARTELAAAGGHHRHTTVTGAGALTPSERRVADLAATGATNRQIAQQLFVTAKTVEVHLSAAYRKLGITSRAQLTVALTTPL
ncbi:LuxR C-terminal-related transcriptional regulator, partial [Streptomyces sp. NPDC002659]|uniref:LuxR C-terminal-related transcriptional regulator n=1 Tax=Streptomyces sp. NPDC002659 TaxID=3364656 RepID=UPI0036C038F4